MKLRSALLLLSSAALVAQDHTYDFSSDTVELSPFTVATPSSRGFDPRYRGGSPSNSPIRIVKRADMVTLTLTISADAKKPDERINALREAMRFLQEAAAKKKDLLVRTGYVELPLATSTRLFSSAKSSEEVSSFDVMLVAKMKETDSIFDRTAYLNSFVDALQFGRGVNVYYVSSGIALSEADQYRGEILRKIGEEYRQLKEVFGPNAEFDIKGLDQRVQVRQLNETNLELSLPYQMILRTKS